MNETECPIKTLREEVNHAYTVWQEKLRVAGAAESAYRRAKDAFDRAVLHEQVRTQVLHELMASLGKNT